MNTILNRSNEYSNSLEANHSVHIDKISLKNWESINLQEFLDSVKTNSIKATNQLPVSQIVKQKILADIWILPYDLQKIKSIYKIGRQWMSQNNRNNPYVLWECQPNYKDWKFSFVIAMENNAPKKLFNYFFYHEIDHMVWYLGYYLSMQQMWFGEDQILSQLQEDTRSLKTEFFARVNTANQTMLWAEDWDFVFSAWTWKAPWKQDIYSQSKNYATKYIAARNKLYNLLLNKYWVDNNARNKYAAIKEPWYTKFAKICTTLANYLFFVDSFEWFKSYIDQTSQIVWSSSTIEQAIDRLTGKTGEMIFKVENINFMKPLLNQHKNVLEWCK